MSQPFIAYDPRPEDYWRGIIMFGRNVASYKFALGQALLDFAPPPVSSSHSRSWRLPSLPISANTYVRRQTRHLSGEPLP